MWSSVLFVLGITCVVVSTASTTSKGQQLIDVVPCGSHKGCIRSPHFCYPPHCDNIFTWRLDKGIVHFEFSIKPYTVDIAPINAPWISIGFSPDGGMPHTFVTDCIVNSTIDAGILIQNSYNYGHDNAPLGNPQLGILPNGKSGSYVDGLLTCFFTREVTVKSTAPVHKHVVDLTKSYIFLLASGPTDGQGYKRQHSHLPLCSTNLINVSQNLNINIGDDPPNVNFIQIHGSLMVLAWLVFASMGIVMARYGKPLWGEYWMCKKKVWFQIHRTCMVLTLLLTCGGIIMIFVLRSTLPLRMKLIHPFIGLVVLCLVIINPLMALFRPHMESPNRKKFNVAHSLVGNLAHILAVVAIGFASRLPMANLSPNALYVVVAFGCLRIFVDIILTVHCAMADGSARTYQELTGLATNTIQDISYRDLKFKKGVFAVYTIGTLTTAALLLYYIRVAYP